MSGLSRSFCKRFLFFSAILVVFLLVFILTRLYPFYADDWGYIFSSQSLAEHATDIFDRLSHQYETWGGRSLVHGIAHILFRLGETGGDILNSLGFVLYIYMIYKISNRSKPLNVGLFLTIGLFVWLAVPAFNSTVLWMVGAANYMWGALIVITFLYAYHSYFFSEKERKGIFIVILFLIGGFISGWTNENMFVAQVFFIVGFFIMLRWRKEAIPLWAIAGLVGVCIGGLVMISAPGNFIRTEEIKEGLGMTDQSLLYTIGYRVLKICHRYVIYIMPITFVYFIVFYLYKKYSPEEGKRKILYGSLLFFGAAHMAWLAMAASYIFPARATFGIITLLIVATGILFANCEIQLIKEKNIAKIVLGVAVVLFIVNYGLHYKNISYMSSKFAEREKIINEQKASGNRFIIFDEKIVMPTKYEYEDLSHDASYWLNTHYSKFHGVDSVRVIKKD